MSNWTAAMSSCAASARTAARSRARACSGNGRGVQHVVTVRQDDFEFEGRPYQSLSAIARHITGTRWNGWTFFGLRTRGDA